MNLDEKFEHITECIGEVVQAHLVIENWRYTTHYKRNKSEFDEYLAEREADLNAALRSLLHTA